MANEELVMLIRSGKDEEKNMELLYSQVKLFMRKIAWKYKQNDELDDLLQEGFLALHDAVEGYDPAAGLSFISYLALYLKTRFSRYVIEKGSCVRLPVHQVENIRKYQRFCSTYFLEHGREPPKEAVALYMCISLEQVEQIQENACMARVGSLDKPMKEEEEGTIGDFVGDPSDQIGEAEERINQEQLREALWGCVDALPDQQAETIRARYIDGCTFKETGERLGMTGDAARQQEAKALRKLRMGENRNRLLPFFPEYDRIFSMGSTGIGVGVFERTWTSATERAALKQFE